MKQRALKKTKKALQAYILLHELGHFERWYEETAPVAEALEIEAYCDRLSLKVLSEEMSSSESEHFRTGRLFILLRTMGNINRSIKSAVVPLYQNGVCDPAAPQYQVNIQRADINHATTLFLHDLNRELDCAEIVTEYKNLMEKFSLTISRHKAGFGYEINSAVIYKAAQILLSSGNADEPSLSGLQREILELYVEGLEYFCSTKCRAWKASIAEQSSSGTASRCDPEWDGPFLDSR
ncbi:MAG: hypothetical protein LRY51_08480 [Geovibrio sp.]|nr:hypothetical protein [Geovibrio sp.]